MENRAAQEFNAYLTAEQFEVMAYKEWPEALEMSKQLGQNPRLVQLAFIKRAQGRDALAEAAELDAGALLHAFNTAHRTAHTRAVELQDHIDTGRRLSGPAMALLARLCGLSIADISRTFGINERTVRGWYAGEAGYQTVNPSVSSAMWTAFDAMLDDAGEMEITAHERGRHTGYRTPVFTAEDMADRGGATAVMAAVLLATRGLTFVVDPNYCPHDADRRTCPECAGGENHTAK